MDANVNHHGLLLSPSRLAQFVKSIGSRGRGKDGGTNNVCENEPKKRDEFAPNEAYYGKANINEMGERRDYQTGIFGDADVRLVDTTDILHSLAATNFDVNAFPRSPRRDVDEDDVATAALRRRLMAQLGSLPDQLWHLIVANLCLADQTSLALACKITFAKFARDALAALALPENKQEKLKFLRMLDMDLPHHILCFHCGTYHARVQPGSERLVTEFVNRPVFICPRVRDTVLPRSRLAHGRELPYVFVQLVVRAAQFGPDYGISVDALSRRWRDPSSGWQHQTRYLIHQGRLLLRVRSQVWARPNLTPSAMRLLLFDREEYLPYFSVCAHWRDGELTGVCKCVLSHVPEPPPSMIQKIKNRPAAAMARPLLGAKPSSSSGARQCGFCAQGRRCPECPSEYVVKIVRAEDKYSPGEGFKNMLVVTRWCDLGDGSGPHASPEWASINGLLAGYSSFAEVHNRALSGTFESAVTGIAPANRLISLNPKNVKKGEAGNDWY